MPDQKTGDVRIKEEMTKKAKQIAKLPYSGVTVPDAKISKIGFRMIGVENHLMFYKVFDEEKGVVLPCSERLFSVRDFFSYDEVIHKDSIHFYS